MDGNLEVEHMILRMTMLLRDVEKRREYRTGTLVVVKEEIVGVEREYIYVFARGCRYHAKCYQ